MYIFLFHTFDKFFLYYIIDMNIKSSLQLNNLQIDVPAVKLALLT